MPSSYISSGCLGICPDSPINIMESPEILPTAGRESGGEGGGHRLTDHSFAAHNGTFSRFFLSLRPPLERSPAPQMILSTNVKGQGMTWRC